MSAAVRKLASEHTQYQRRVVNPLKAKRGWHGGGQPDAAAVAEINGLAIDTTRLHAAAGAAAYLYACAGFAVAQTCLAALEAQIRADDMSVDTDGNVSTTYVPIGDDNGLGSPSAKVLRYQQKIGRILAFATKVDNHTAHALNTSREPAVTTLTNRPGLLDQARAGNADAARDARCAVAEIKRLGDDAAHDLPSLTDILPDLPTYDVQIPPGAPACAWLGAALLAIGLNGVEWGAIGGLLTAIETDGVGALTGAGVSVGGALLAGLGVIFLTAGGIGLSQADITRSGSSDGGRGGGPSKSLDDLMQQAKQVENEAKPGYGGEPQITSIKDVYSDPQLLRGKTPQEVEEALKGSPGWRVERLGKGSHRGQGWVFREYTEDGHPTGRQLRWHPGGGHHGSDPYWRVIGHRGDMAGRIP